MTDAPNPPAGVPYQPVDVPHHAAGAPYPPADAQYTPADAPNPPVVCQAMTYQVAQHNQAAALPASLSLQSSQEVSWGTVGLFLV